MDFPFGPQDSHTIPLLGKGLETLRLIEKMMGVEECPEWIGEPLEL